MLRVAVLADLPARGWTRGEVVEVTVEEFRAHAAWLMLIDVHARSPEDESSMEVR